MSQLDGPFIKRWSERGKGIRKGISCVIPEVMLKNGHQRESLSI